jgi:hypothetical protein
MIPSDSAFGSLGAALVLEQPVRGSDDQKRT